MATVKPIFCLNLPNISGIGKQPVEEIKHDMMDMMEDDMTDMGTEDRMADVEPNIEAKVASLAAIPEADSEFSVLRRSKRRAGSTDEESLDRAARIKAGRNMDCIISKGTIQGDTLA
ncbi:uncharacterized protein LOC133928763 isoform X2 [Phragmites australis]|uniref:uncharacterized protein LOC133928763 isoform X2 n=1 Tax=Phragmites australis TaxID=29695 RepID=UPI002D777619|nr:uncharacterized protein LOC133928763 isoform X2 [Phragmites australis]